MSTTAAHQAADEAMFHAIVARAERRDEPRRPAGISAIVSRIIGGEQVDRLEVRVTDVSARGVGLSCTVPLERGKLYLLHVGPDSGYIRIIRCRESLRGGYNIGALHV